MSSCWPREVGAPLVKSLVQPKSTMWRALNGNFGLQVYAHELCGCREQDQQDQAGRASKIVRERARSRLARSDNDRTAKLKMSIHSTISHTQYFRPCNVHLCEAEEMNWRMHFCLPFLCEHGSCFNRYCHIAPQNFAISHS
jgi:hypothetical protein